MSAFRVLLHLPFHSALRLGCLCVLAINVPGQCRGTARESSLAWHLGTLDAVRASDNLSNPPRSAPSSPQNAKAEILVEDFGAKGDGVTDDTLAIQAAVRSCFDNHAKVLRFAAGKTYLLSSDKSQNSLVLYGNDLTVEGNGATLLKASPTGGYWGDALDIHGLYYGHSYPGIGKFTGKSAPARNITVKNLTISHLTQVPFMNSVGIVYVENIILEDITSVNAPQAAFAIVSDALDKPVSKVTLQECKAVNSGYHAYQVSLEENADTLNVIMDRCTSVGVRNADTNRFKEASGIKIHLWFRGAGQHPNVGLKVIGCSFDDSATILTTQGTHNLVIQDSDIEGEVVLKGGSKSDSGFRMTGNRMNPTHPVKDLRR